MDGELGAFLRSRREAVSPAEVGLPGGLRRRTPGLRRSELATLAGVSVDYLIRLEQGRDTNPSTQVLAALAEALRLSDEDVEHLRELASLSTGLGLCPGEAPRAARAVRPNILALLTQLEPAPAVVLNHHTDLLAWNDGYQRFAGPLGILDRAEPNLLWFTLADDRARTAYADWEDVADEQVAYLHELRRGDAGVDEFAAGLARAAGPEFVRRWERRPLATNRTGVTGVRHPDVGLLRLAFEALELADRQYQRLVVYLPADATTAAGLEQLPGHRPGTLRVVSGQ